MRIATALLLAFSAAPFLLAQAPESPTPVAPSDKPTEGPTGDQQKAALEWVAISTRCKAAIRDNQPADALKLCKAALDLATQSAEPTSNEQYELVESHQLYGRAFLVSGDSQQALDQENQSIEAAKKYLKDTDQEYAVPFFWRAMIEANRKEVDAALADFQVSEDTHRRAMAAHPKMAKAYGHYLASILREHALVLERAGRSDEAAKLRAEAASL